MSSTKDEAISLLSLDGGGVRGVASLVILHEIMLKIKDAQGLAEIPKPCDYFHMIGGTSTGGLIAVMLGRLRMSTEEALKEYDQCAEKIFSGRNKKWTSLTDKYRATALKEAIEDLVRRRNMGEYLYDHSLRYDSKGQCFVCVMPAHDVAEPRRFRSFGQSGIEDLANVKIWEAARATTAASFFFKPMTIRVGKRKTEDYIDAAIGCNNPSDFVLREAADRIGTGRRLCCLVSIGTGTRSVHIGKPSTGLRNIVHAPTFLKELVGTLKNTATDSEKTHRDIQARIGGYPKAYFRFNVPNTAAEVKLHEYLKMGSLKATTTAYLTDPLIAAEIQTVVDVLGRNLSGHGLTLGHTHELDKDQVLLTTHEAQELGHTSRFFTGRGDILSRIDACFAERDTGGKPRREFLLYGMGGVGKTQIALKAADDLEERFKHIFHIDGTDTLTASQSYAQICQEHRLGMGTASEMKDLALQWIEGLSVEWLMIYDNCPEQERLHPVLPRRNKGNVIYTSRSQGFQADIPSQFACEVKPFEEEDAINMLLGIAGREHLRSDEEEVRSAKEIVASVGYLPLAIESAGAYMREGGCNGLTYLQRYHNRLIRPQQVSNENSDGSSPARPALYTALDLSYEAIVGVRRRKGRSVIGRAAESALQALNLLCFYHNEKIPALMLERASKERLKWGSLGVQPLSDLAEDPFMNATYLAAPNLSDGTWNSLFFDLGVQILQRYSLAKLSPNRQHVSMHILVQAWAQNKMEEDDTRKRQALAAKMILIESVIVSWERHETAWLRMILSHLQACLAHEAAPVTHDPYQAILDFKLGWCYMEEKQFPKAIEHLSNALRIWKYERGVHSESAVTVLVELGKVYHEMGWAGDAELAYLEAADRLDLRFAELRTEGEESRAREKARQERRAIFDKLARLARPGNPNVTAKDDEPEVEHTENQAGEDEQELDGNPRATADNPKPVAGQEDAPPSEGKVLEEQFMENISPGAKRKPQQYTLDDYRFEAASITTELARLDFDQGDFGSGKRLVTRAMDQLKECGYPDDVRVWALEDELIRRFQNGGDIRHWVGRTSALRAFPKDVYQDAAAQEYSFVWPIGYATYLTSKEEDWQGAYEMYGKSLELATMYYGAGDRRTLYLMRKMALCQCWRGNFEEAEALARTAVERAKVSYGQYHLHTAKCLDMLAFVLTPQTLDVRPGSELRNVVEEAYDSARIVLSEHHYLTIRLKARLDSFRLPRSQRIAVKNVDDNPEPQVEPQPMKPGNSAAEEHDEFSDHIDKMFADGRPESEDEYMAIVSAEYREYMRKKLQAKAKEKKQPTAKRPAAKKVEPAESCSQVDSSTEPANEGPVGTAEDPEPSRPERKEKWKGKQKADITLSPILEDETGFHVEADRGSPNLIEEGPEKSPQDVKGKVKAVVLPRPVNRGPFGEGTSKGWVTQES